LPHGLGVSGAGAADDAGSDIGARRAAAWAAAARCGGAQAGAPAITKSAEASDRAGTRDESGDEGAGAGIVPGNFRDVADGGFEGRTIRRAPIGGILIVERVDEIGAADRNIEGRGGEAADADAVRRRCGVCIATGGAFVARRNED